jgi:O-antigen/teichoic acid export membrane protein
VKRLGLNAGALAAAQVGGQLIGLAMLVIVSRQIGPAYLGAYAFSYNIVAYVGLATTIGLPVLGMRELGRQGADPHRVLSETVTARLGLSLLLGALLVATSRWIAPSHASRVLLPLLAIKLVIEAVTFDWYLQGTGRHPLVAAARFLGQIAYAAVLIPLLAGGLTGARHYVIANLVGLAVTAGIMSVFALRGGRVPSGKVAIATIRRRVRSSTPFFWWIALTQIYYSTDLILVGYIGGDRDAGLYAAASKLPLSVIGVAALWFTVAMPETARLHSAEQTDVIRRQTRVSATAAIVVGLPFVLIGPLFARDIATTLFGAKFSASGPALAILSASVAVSLLQIVVTSVIMGAGRERPYVKAMSLGAGANVLLNLILIPLIGIIGAAIATIAAESTVLAVGLYQMHHITGRLPMRPRAIMEAAGITVGAAGVSLLMRLELGFWSAACGAVSVYALAITFRTIRNPRWLSPWLGNV